MARKGTRKPATRGSTRRNPPAERNVPAVDPVTYGLLLAGLIAGLPLWTLYQAGDIDPVDLLLRGGLVAVGCGVGITAINRLIAEYRRQTDREQRIQQMMDAIEDVVHEGQPISPAAPGTPPARPRTPDRPDRQHS